MNEGNLPSDRPSRWWVDGPPWIYAQLCTAVLTAGITAGIAIFIFLGVENHFHNERQESQTQLSNIAFVRQVMISGSKLKPFSGLDLRAADLAFLDLSCDEEGVDEPIEVSATRCADFRNADLRGANLAGANLRGALLSGARLDGANLVGANLQESRLNSAVLDGARLSRIDFDSANAAGASFVGASADSANFSGTAIDGANFSGADLTKVYGLGPASLAREPGPDDPPPSVCFNSETKFPKDSAAINRDPAEVEKVCKSFEKDD